MASNRHISFVCLFFFEVDINLRMIKILNERREELEKFSSEKNKEKYCYFYKLKQDKKFMNVFAKKIHPKNMPFLLIY